MIIDSTSIFGFISNTDTPLRKGKASPSRNFKKALRSLIAPFSSYKNNPGIKVPDQTVLMELKISYASCKTFYEDKHAQVPEMIHESLFNTAEELEQPIIYIVG